MCVCVCVFEGGEEKERRVLGIEMAFVRGHMHWLFECLYTAVQCVCVCVCVCASHANNHYHDS